jgi:hypothetical protein
VNSSERPLLQVFGQARDGTAPPSCTSSSRFPVSNMPILLPPSKTNEGVLTSSSAGARLTTVAPSRCIVRVSSTVKRRQVLFAPLRNLCLQRKERPSKRC